MARSYGHHYLTEEQKKLAEENIGLVWYFVKQQIKKGRIQPHEVDELSGYLMMHYCLSCEKYDPLLNTKFSTYAFNSFNHAISNYRMNNKRFYGRFVTCDYNNLDENVSFIEPVFENKTKKEVDFDKIDNILMKAKLDSFEHQTFHYKHKLYYNYTEIGEIMGYSKERIRQFYESGLKKIIAYVKKSGYSMDYFLK